MSCSRPKSCLDDDIDHNDHNEWRGPTNQNNEEYVEFDGGNAWPANARRSQELHARRERSCVGICGDSPFDAGEANVDEDIDRRYPSARTPFGSESATDETPGECGYGRVLMKGIITYRNRDVTRVMVLYQYGVLAWYLPEHDFEMHSGIPPESKCLVSNVVVHVLGVDLGNRHSEDDSLLLKDLANNVSFTLDIASGPNALAWHHALEHCRLENDPKTAAKHHHDPEDPNDPGSNFLCL